MRKSTFVLAFAAIIAAGVLAGCGSEPVDPNAPPPPPPQVYTVIHKDLDGTVTIDRALSYYYSEGGCVSYDHPDDQGKNRYRRLFCGGTTQVKPEER